MAAADETPITPKSLPQVVVAIEPSQPAEQRRSTRGSSVRGEVIVPLPVFKVDCGSTKLKNIIFQDPLPGEAPKR